MLALGQLARLTPSELARLDALAANQGLTRQAMLIRLLSMGSAAAAANDAAPADRIAGATPRFVALRAALVRAE